MYKKKDLVLLDIKEINPEKHRVENGHSNKNILECARYLSDIGKPVWIRHVLVPNLTSFSSTHLTLPTISPFFISFFSLLFSIYFFLLSRLFSLFSLFHFFFFFFY
ncbi:hypothetical protein OEZ72_26310, partial [Leclercia adecarboxylata]|nr:hypothetical protein [Leclercia adecarboxylata]